MFQTKRLFFFLVIFFLAFKANAQIEIKPSYKSMEGHPDVKITRVVLNKLNTVISIELTSDRTLDNKFLIIENGVNKYELSKKETNPRIEKGIKIRSADIYFSPVRGDTRQIDFFEDCENCAYFKGLNVFSFDNLIQNPTKIANIKPDESSDFTSDFKAYFSLHENTLSVAEGIWDFKILSTSFSKIYSNVLGNYYYEKFKSKNVSIAIIKHPTENYYMFLRMDGGMMDMMLSPTASKSVFFLKRYESSTTARTIFYNPYLANVENLITTDFLDEADKKDVASAVSNFELTKLYPTENDQVEAYKSIKKTGTGFIVSTDGTIATNYHVIDSGSSIKVTLMLKGVKKDYNASVLYSDKANDLALIKITDSSFKMAGSLPYQIKNGLVDIGSPVFTLGYPLTTYLGNEVKYTDGKVSSKTGFQGNIATYQLSVPLQPGNSGGPLFDWDGNVVGITNAIFSGADNISYAIKASYLVNLIDLIPKDKTGSNSVLKDKTMSEKIKLLTEYVVFVQVKQK